VGTELATLIAKPQLSGKYREKRVGVAGPEQWGGRPYVDRFLRTC
jgi:hypothetical protein